ncbi:MAG: LysR substrate-binding domain-containing protein [Pigmentiphaga sp.]|nr:LysR substrate-binding domain-containing protein [Pigmentiphaga sp.]
MKIRLRQVEGFLALADTLSFSRAAQRLGMTQPAFSQMIRELEDALELPLFERSTRRVQLLPAGEQLLDRMRAGLDHLQEAYQQAQALARLEQGQLAVATLPSLACGAVLRVMSAFRQQHPGIALRLYEDHNRQILETLAAGKVDLAVGSAMPDIRQLDFEPLFEDELACILPIGHPLSTQPEIDWKQLADETMILVAASSQTYQMVRETLAVLARGKQAEYQTLNSVTALSMVRAGFGLTMIPAITLPELNMEGLCQRPMGVPKPSRQVGIFRRQGAGLSPAAQAFSRMLGEALRTRTTSTA